MSTEPRGFTLLIAVVLSSVIVSVSLALLDITYKQVTLASAAAQSQYAFYNADTALECALYWDQKANAFDYTTPMASSGITCAELPIQDYATSISGGVISTTFTLPCANGGSKGNVTVTKTNTGVTNIFGNGYNTCAVDDVRRVERGIKATYGN